MTINRLLGKVNEFRTPKVVATNPARPEAPIYSAAYFTGFDPDPTAALFNYAPGETILFTGATVTEESLKGWDGRKLWTVDYHFVEKAIWERYSQKTEYYAVMGWNHFWNAYARQKAGAFERLVIDQATGAGPYRTADLSVLFLYEPFNRNDHPSPATQMATKISRDRGERGSLPRTTTS